MAPRKTAELSIRAARTTPVRKRSGASDSTPPAGTPSRERIHRAALMRFARYGYDAVSLQDIADDVGLHKSSLFHHYSSKAVLLRAVLREVIQGILDHVRQLAADEPPTAERILRVFHALAEHFCDQPDAARLLLAVMTAPDDSELQRQAPDAAEFYVTVAHYLDRARRTGVVGRVPIRQAIPNLVGLVLVYPAVAHQLAALIGSEPFSSRARAARREDLERALRSLLKLE
ncbi:MAG: TetR/AcrR family transcriptional regulator [Polyangiales bacterium]